MYNRIIDMGGREILVKELGKKDNSNVSRGRDNFLAKCRRVSFANLQSISHVTDAALVLVPAFYTIQRQRTLSFFAIILQLLTSSFMALFFAILSLLLSLLIRRLTSLL